MVHLKKYIYIYTWQPPSIIISTIWKEPGGCLLGKLDSSQLVCAHDICRCPFGLHGAGTAYKHTDSSMSWHVSRFCSNFVKAWIFVCVPSPQIIGCSTCPTSKSFLNFLVLSGLPLGWFGLVIAFQSRLFYGAICQTSTTWREPFTDVAVILYLGCTLRVCFFCFWTAKARNARSLVTTEAWSVAENLAQCWKGEGRPLQFEPPQICKSNKSEGEACYLSSHTFDTSTQMILTTSVLLIPVCIHVYTWGCILQVRAAKYTDKDYRHKSGRLGQSSNVLVFKTLSHSRPNRIV